MKLLRILSTALSTLCLLTGGAIAQPLPEGASYVAMGSSYAAGTNLLRGAADSPARCNQGTDSYPRQVASALKLRLIDRSCGGATTENVLTTGQHQLPPQLDAVDASTRLVTITIGGNDVRLVADLGMYSCAHRRDEVPEANRSSVCAAAPDFREDAAFMALEKNLRAIVEAIHTRAPSARVMFVDYVTIVPPSGTCAALGLDERAAAAMRRRAQRLASLTAEIARSGDADLIAASRLSSDHSACAEDPWSWGFVANYDRATSAEVPFHPNIKAHTAIATAIVAKLRR